MLVINIPLQHLDVITSPKTKKSNRTIKMNYGLAYQPISG